MAEDIKIDTNKIKNKIGGSLDFFRNKKVVNILVIVLLLVTLIGGVVIRTKNLDLLKDQTTGEYIPLALDPFYFLRIAEKMTEPGSLPVYDDLRQPYDISYTDEILPDVVYNMYKVMKIFNGDITIQYVDVISPVVFFALGLIVFFFLVYFLTGSKIAALLSSIFLSVIPSYLYRTMAGFADHESIGMFAFLLVLLGFTLSLKFLNKESKENNKKHRVKIILFSLLVGFLSAFTIATWGGVANFIFMIIPLSFGLFWLTKTQNIEESHENKRDLLNYVLFYVIWIVSTIIFAIFYGYSLNSSFGRVLLTPTSVLTGFFLLFVLIDFALIHKKTLLKTGKQRKYRVLISLAGTILLGIIFAIIFFGGISYITNNIIGKLLQPFGGGRIGSTVAENQQPYLNDWRGQTGKIFFWFFLGGLISIGIGMGSQLKNIRNRSLFIFFWSLFILGLLFSRISSDSLFNGNNFISKLFYFGSALLFLVYFITVYFKEKIKINPEYLVMFSWAIFMLIAARSAIRTFFLITPFACFSYGIFMTTLFSYTKKSKEELLRILLVIFLIIVIIASLFSFNNFFGNAKAQAEITGPSAGSQWQQAMKWVRENTAENSIFLHWWDYGYWVQYLGQRPTLSDGGHFEGSFRDHVVGRYILTTPQPETALSFIKTNNASYLLIDPTDIGKYSAYSSIGSDETGRDRASYIPTMVLDPSQTQETENSEINVYSGPVSLDQDIIYNSGNGDILLPEGKAAILGFVLESESSQDSLSFNQPQGVFLYNQDQIRIPLRYLYFNGQILDFENGLEAGVFLMPFVSQSSGNLQIRNTGAALYLSPKTFNSLVVQLYLMDDPLNRYPTISVAHLEKDPVVASLEAQGWSGGDEFVYFSGFRGPLKIFDTRTIPSNILEKEEFLRRDGEFAEFDNLQFIM